MIDYSHFKREDFEVLFEGFETAFLQIPFKHPTKAINQLIPKWLKSKKLNRSQMIKVFTDAILNGELSICSLVTNEIETQFEKAGITNFIESKKGDSDYLCGVGIATVSSILWKNQLHIPAYIVLLLFGIDTSETCKEESMRIYKTFYEELEKYGQQKINEGISRTEQKNRSIIETEKKRADKLEKNLSSLKNQKDEAFAKIKIANSERDEAITKAESNAERIKECQEIIERLEKEITRTAYTIKLSEEKLEKKQEVERRLAEKREECIEKDKQIVALKNDLLKAQDMAYSEEVLKHLCVEVLDELSAISLGNQEILRIAKERFSSEETVLAGWESLSKESNELIKIIVDQFNSGSFSTRQLDLLERMEDGILIRYAVTKSLKAILYGALEKLETETKIGERFGGKGDV